MRAIDLFSGLGGSTEGAHRAGCSVIWAANHWPVAVEWHKQNHPMTHHACQDLQKADWSAVPKHDLLLASPACQGHANARGTEKPHHDNLRNTAWAVVECAEYHLPSFIVVENVPEFAKWALYPIWVAALQKLGYSISTIVRDAADHGVPQNRLRLFVIATRSANPIKLKFDAMPHAPISSVIDWETSNWALIDKPGRSVATLKRITNGRKSHGERFVAPYYGSGSGLTGRSIHRPIGTITTVEKWAVVCGDRMRMLSVHEAKLAMGFSSDYAIPQKKGDAIKLLGNAVVSAVMADICAQLLKHA